MISYLITFLIAMHSKKISTVIVLTTIVQILVSIMAGMFSLRVDEFLAVELLISFIAKLALGVCVFYIYQRMTRRVTPKEYKKHKIVTSICVTAVIMLMIAIPIYLAIQDGQEYRERTTAVNAELASSTKVLSKPITPIMDNTLLTPNETDTAVQTPATPQRELRGLNQAAEDNRLALGQSARFNPLGTAATTAVEGQLQLQADTETIGYIGAGVLLSSGLLILIMSFVKFFLSKLDVIVEVSRDTFNQVKRESTIASDTTKAIDGLMNNLPAHFKLYLIGVIAGLIILTLTGWIGFGIVVAGATLLWYRTVSVGRETARSFLFLLALEQGKNVVEANTFAYASPTDSSDIASAAQQYAALHFGGSYFVMCNAAKGSGFYH